MEKEFWVWIWLIRAVCCSLVLVSRLKSGLENSYSSEIAFMKEVVEY